MLRYHPFKARPKLTVFFSPPCSYLNVMFVQLFVTSCLFYNHDSFNSYSQQEITRSKPLVMETGSKSSDASVKKKESHTKYVTKSSPKSVHWKSGLPNQKRKRKSSQKDGKIFIEDSKNGIIAFLHSF